MRRTIQRAETAPAPSPSPKGWARPMQREGLPTDQDPMYTSTYRKPPTVQLVEPPEADHHGFKTDAKESKPTILFSYSEDNTHSQGGNWSHIQYQRAAEKLPRTSSIYRQPSPLAGLEYQRNPVCRLTGDGAHQEAPSAHQSVETKADSIAAPRPRLACRYSFEDHKRNQIVEWLDRGNP